MKQVRLWMMSAILAISGTSVFTACTTYSDNPVVKPVGIAIDETNFPDGAFRKYLFDNYKFAKDGILTDEEIRNTTELNISFGDIKTIKGIEYFTALETLRCNDNELTELDLSKNTRLKYLDCSYNHLTMLNLSNNVLLDILFCEENELTELDVSNNTALLYMDCYDNKLTKLDVTKNTDLVQLDCDNNQLTSLDLKNPWLEELYCSGNQLTKLDFSANQKLEMIECYNNKISGQDMDDMIASLPLNDTPTFFDLLMFYFRTGERTEGNVCTKSQVAALKAKGWLPQQWDVENYEWIEYPGSDE